MHGRRTGDKSSLPIKWWMKCEARWWMKCKTNSRPCRAAWIAWIMCRRRCPTQASQARV